MRSRVTVVCLSVCVCLLYRSNCSSVDPCCPIVVLTESARYFQGFSLVDFAKSALFKSYGLIYLFDRHGHISSTVRSLDPGPLSYVRIRKNAEENGGSESTVRSLLVSK